MGSFALDLSRFADKAGKVTVDKIQKVAMEAFGRVIMRSPVGNPDLWTAEFKAVGESLGWFDKNYTGGRFRANWGVQIGAPWAGTIEAKDPTPVGDKSGPTVAAAEWKASEWNGVGSIFLSNNLPYAIPLEYGHSKQAPGGMVRVTIAELQGGAAEAAVK